MLTVIGFIFVFGFELGAYVGRWVGRLSAVARQAKLMKQRVGMEDEEDEEEQEEKQRAVWGRGKKIYYGADHVDREVRDSYIRESLPAHNFRFCNLGTKSFSWFGS